MKLLLAIDTCGPAGTVALASAAGGGLRILAQQELAGRTYSARLVAAVRELLTGANMKLSDVAALIAVSGPGSFTGVRIGLSVVKGLAEPFGIPVAAVSRLAVLAGKAGVASAALDAHRNEIFLRMGNDAGSVRELLAGESELAAIEAPMQIAVCDEAAAKMLARSWPGTEMLQCEAPTAADALRLALPCVREKRFADLALLDGNYLRRSDAEIFGTENAAGLTEPAQGRP